MNEAIDACGRAIEALKNSKGEMRGAKLDLVQVTADLDKALKKKTFSDKTKSLPGNTIDTVSFLSKIHEDGAPKFEYQSNDIIATLEDLLATFKFMKMDLDTDEHNNKAADERTILGMANERKFAEKERDEKSTIAGAKQERLSDKTDQRKDESDDQQDDFEFMKRLERECSDRAEAFDQRSGVRANELTALSQATEELEAGASPNYEKNLYHNKNLVELQKSSTAGKQPAFPKVASPATFVQINKVEHMKRHRLMDRVSKVLNEAAEKSDSGALAAIATRVQVAFRQEGEAVDHFVKVRGLIQDLLDKLKADETSEASQKENCDTGIREATNQRDNAQAEIEIATGKHTTLTADLNSLEDDNEKLAAQIAELKKALLESRELYQVNLEEAETQIGLWTDSWNHIDMAMQILSEFYSKHAFIQKQKLPNDFLGKDFASAKEFQTGMDRDGNRVRDLAPETEDAKYQGAQAESEGILNVLEVISADFKKSLKQAQDDKVELVALQEMFEKDTEADLKRKDQLISKNDFKISSVNEMILNEENTLKDNNGILEGALNELATLHTMCVKGEETYEERKATREREIAALREAVNILENWQG